MPTDELSLEVYKNIFETWRSQVDSYWERSNYFAAFETALIAGCWYIVEHPHRRSALAFSFLGLVSAVIWLYTIIAMHSYIDYWRESILIAESKLELKQRELDFMAKHPGSCLWPRPSTLVATIPILFILAWLVMLIAAYRIPGG